MYFSTRIRANRAERGGAVIHRRDRCIVAQGGLRWTMPHWLIIALFLALVAALVIIVRWEFSRVRDGPRSMSGAVKRYLETERTVPPSPVPNEIKRGFDAWD
jgi:hypothetical protein